MNLTAGQVWTLGLGTALGVTLLATSIPAVLRDRPAAALSAPGPVVAPLSVAPPPPVVVVPPPAGPPPGVPALPPGLEPVVPAPVGTDALPPGSPELGASQPDSLQPEPAHPEPAPTDPVRSGSPTPGPSTPGPTTLLRVLSGGFSSTDPDAVATAGVPADGFPVSVRAGSVVDTSYLRLTGTGTLLTLVVDPASGSTTGPDPLDVMACRITTSTWRAARPGPAVAYDMSACVRAVTLPDGRRRLDLAAYPDRTDARGFALVADLSRDPSPSTRTARVVLLQEKP